MKTNQLVLGILLTSMGISLNSCQNRDEFFENAKKTNWANEFNAPIDVDQDWNLAQEFTVSVSPASATTYSIYSKVNNVYKLVAKYDNVSSACDLKFTTVKGTKEVLVSDGINTMTVPVFGEFGSSTRTASSWTDGEFKCDESLLDASSVTELDLDYAASLLPENGDNKGKEGMAVDYMFYNGNYDGFTIFPVFSYTGARLRLGIYYYDEEGNRVEHEVWRIDDTMKAYDEEAKTNLYKVQTVNPKGIHIRTPKNKAFGFYIDKVSVKYYSQTALNNCHEQHTATFEKDGLTYITFEDACKAPMDINDLIVVVKPDLVPIVEDPAKWMVACEDLGSTCDYDFNDVVFEVEHVTGQENVTITPLAAGGLLSSVVYLGDTKVGEIHELLGGKPGQFLNTTSFGSAGTPVVVGGQSAFQIATDMGGLRVAVEQNGDAEIIMAPKSGEVPQMIMVPEGWQWPLEHVSIKAAYPGFVDWSKAAATYDYWTSSRDDSKVVKR